MEHFIRKYAILFIGSFILIFFSCNRFEETPYPDVKFERVASMPDGGRASAVSFVVDDKAYVALGRNKGAKSNCFQYNPQTDKWKEVAPFPGNARVNASATVVNGEAYVGLGYDPSAGVYNYDAALKDFWKYNPKDDTWKRLADFPANSTNKCICFSFGEKVYIGFGFSVYHFTHDLWMYDPSTDKWSQLSQQKVKSRAGAIACSNSDYIYFGTGYNTENLNDWWRYNPRDNNWKQLKSIPGTGRITAVAFSLDKRIFIGTGRLFKGNLTGGHLKDDLLEYDIGKDVWYYRGTIPGGGRENAISFVVDGKAFVGLGENEEGILDDLWLIRGLN